jgi:hypothetical protein
MHKLKSLLEQHCATLPGLIVTDDEAAFEVKWRGSFGVLVSKASSDEEALVCWEAKPVQSSANPHPVVIAGQLAAQERTIADRPRD